MKDDSAYTHADVVCIDVVSRRVIGSFQNDPRVIICNESIDIRNPTIVVFLYFNTFATSFVFLSLSK